MYVPVNDHMSQGHGHIPYRHMIMLLYFTIV